MSLTIPNLLSILRMGLVPFFIISVIEGQPRRALAVFIAAGVTDALDGAIARLYHQHRNAHPAQDPIAPGKILRRGKSSQRQLAHNCSAKREDLLGQLPVLFRIDHVNPRSPHCNSGRPRSQCSPVRA